MRKIYLKNLSLLTTFLSPLRLQLLTHQFQVAEMNGGAFDFIEGKQIYSSVFFFLLIFSKKKCFVVFVFVL